MKPAIAFALLALGLGTVAAGIALRPRMEAAPAGAGQPVVTKPLNTTTSVTLTGGGKTSTLVLKNGRWTMAERDFYPVQPQKMRALFTGLSELRLAEPRTADPSLLGRLGVDDPATPGSTAIALRITDADNLPLANLILGHRRQRTQGGLPESIYIRKPTETRAWRAEGSIPAEADPQAWLVRDIIDLPRDRVASVTVERDGLKLLFTRDGEHMTLSAPPPGKLDEYRVDQMGQALEGLTLADVKEGPLPGTPVGTAMFTTADGLIVNIVLSRDDKLLWASVAARGTGADAYAGLAGWAFQLPEWRQTGLVPALSDLLQPDAPK